MYEWFLRKCKEKQPEIDAEYQTRLLLIVSGFLVLSSLYFSYKDYAVIVWHVSKFNF